MAKAVTPDAVSTILANPCPDSSTDLPEIIVQVLDLKPTGTKYMCVFVRFNVSPSIPHFMNLSSLFTILRF